MLNLMFAGNVGGEVVLREVTVRDETVKVASFNVAVNNGTNAQGDELPPTWIKVSVWRVTAQVEGLLDVKRLSENLMQSL